MQLKVKTSSERIWWGIYGFVHENGWEDVEIYDEQGVLIDRIHLYAKNYLRAGLRFIKNDVEQLDYTTAINKYLVDDQFYYWYYYDDLEDEARYEVAYEAPKNGEGIKPKSIEIWIPEEGIGIASLKSGVQQFAKKFLKIENCEVKIDPIKTIEASIETFKMSAEKKPEDLTVKVNLSPQQIYELSKLWNKSESDIYNKLSNFNKK